MKAATKAKLARAGRAFYARMKKEEPQKWQERIDASRARYYERRAKAEQVSDGKHLELGNAISASPLKEPEEPGSPVRSFPVTKGESSGALAGDAPESGALFGKVCGIPFNPKMALVRLSDGMEVETIVGLNNRLWLECPVEVRPSGDYPGYYELVGELPKGRWDRAYAERFADNGGN